MQFAIAANDDEPPLVGQPPHFNGAVGRFRVTTTAEPVKLQAEDPLTYTVRVTGAGPLKEPPQRPPLAEFPRFAADFYIEDRGLPEGAQPDPNTWEFAYRLKPKSTAVVSVPSFPFVFYRPGFLPPRLGYMTVYAPEIALTVTPRAAVVGPPASVKPITGPDTAFVLADGDVLRPDDDRLPGPVVLALLLLAPPAGCVAWCLVWRRLYPDAARRARRHRSRAAREALRALHGLERATPPDQARATAAAVADYLRRRLGLRVAEPTPAEAQGHLRRHGVSDDLAGQTADLLRACASAQYDPGPPPDADLTGAASGLILALEAETCSD